MSALTEKIRSRGYIAVELFPDQFVRDRIPYEQLDSILTAARVQIGGWEFPHVGRGDEVKRENEWYGGESQWEHRLEACRLYQSGLFVDLRGFGWDWRDESEWWPRTEDWRPDTSVSVSDTLHRFLETYLFAANLTATAAGDEVMHLEITLGNLQTRELIVDPRRTVFAEPRTTNMQKYVVERKYSRAELGSRARDLALEESRLLFQRFGWQTTTERLTELLNP